MNLDELLPDTGKQTAVHAANVAMKNVKLIPVLLKAAFFEKHPMATRAANTLEIIDSEKPRLIRPYYRKILSAFPDFNVDGQKRCLLKIFTRHVKELKEYDLCLLLNICFRLLVNSAETVGVKAYSMMILFDISKQEPDIINELKAAINSQLDANTKAFQCLGTKMIKMLEVNESKLATAN